MKKDKIVIGTGKVTGYNLVGAVFMEDPIMDSIKKVVGRKGTLVFISDPYIDELAWARSEKDVK